MKSRISRYSNVLFLLPLIAAGTYLSVRADQDRFRIEKADPGGPPSFWKPALKKVTQIEGPHDLRPVPNTNPNAPAQPLRDHPIRIVATPDGRKAYVTLHGSELHPGHEVAVVDLQRGELIRRIRVGERPKGLALHPDGRFLVVLNWFSDYATVIDTQKDEVTSEFYLPYYSQQIIFNRAGTTGYVTNFWKGQVLLVDVNVRGGTFEARMRDMGGFSRLSFLGYQDLAQFDRRFAQKLEEQSRQKEGWYLARCGRCGWADWYPPDQGFQCKSCGAWQDFKGRRINAEIITKLSREKVSLTLKTLPAGVNVSLRARCGTAGCHLQPAGGFVAGEDVDANYESTVANCVPGDGEGSYLLRICTSTAHGGYADSLTGTYHAKAGVVFKDPVHDTDYQTIKGWIDQASEGPGITVGNKPDALALSQDEKLLYVANPFEQSISVVDLQEQREVRRVFTQSVITDLKVIGHWLVACGLGSGFGAPKKHDPDGRESLDRSNPQAEFSLWRDPTTGKPLPIEHQKVLGPFAHVDGTAQMKFRDISNDLLVINLDAESKAAPAADRGWSLDVSRYKATPEYTRYVADTFEFMFGDKKGDVASSLLKVIGAHPEQIAQWQDTIFVVNAGSFEIAEYRLNLDSTRPEDRLIPLDSYETDLHPRGMWVAPGGRYLLTANFFGENVSIIDRQRKQRKDVALGKGPRFPATDAERGELFVETSILSADGDQSCVHCHYRDAGDGRAWSVSQAMGTNRDQTEERAAGSHKVPPCVRNLFVQVPLFVEGTLSIDEPLTMIMEQNPLIDFAAPTPRQDFTHEFCPRDQEELYAKSADTVITAAPLGAHKQLPGGARLVDLAYRRDLHFRQITRKYWGQEYGVRDIQKFVGDFQAAEARLLPNPNSQVYSEDPEVKYGRALFFSPDVGCASCHPPPNFTLKDGIYNQNAALPPLITPNPRDDAHMLVSADRQDLNLGFVRYWDKDDKGRIEENEGFFTTPSLRGVWALPAVFLHHGQARGLREVVCVPGHPALRRIWYPTPDVTFPRPWEKGHNETNGLPDTHGQTSHLSYRQINALVKYLQSIE